MSKKALMVANLWGFFNNFERNDIKILQNMGYSVYCAANRSVNLNANSDYGQLDDLNITKCQIDFSRSPYSLATFKAYRQLKKLIADNQFDIIHCHTPVPGILTRFAARKQRRKGTKVIYTAHGFHFFKGAPLINWLLYYPAEKLCSYFTDVLITINHEDYERAKKKMHAKKVEYIPGVGVDTKKFSYGLVDKGAKRKELGLTEDNVFLLSVGELIPRKNHKIVIEAIAKLQNPNLKYFISGTGELQRELEELIKRYSLSDQVHLLGYRNDISELCQAADLFIFPSLQEGLPLALMEAMACGCNVICSNIRGNTDLLGENSNNLFDPMDLDEITVCIQNYIDKSIVNNYNRDLIRCFDLENVMDQMTKLYVCTIGTLYTGGGVCTFD